MKLPTIKITRTLEYSPENYLECCKETQEEPSLEGFKEFILDSVDFEFEMGDGKQEIQEIY